MAPAVVGNKVKSSLLSLCLVQYQFQAVLRVAVFIVHPLNFFYESTLYALNVGASNFPFFIIPMIITSICEQGLKVALS